MVGAKTIPSYGPVYTYLGGQDLQMEREGQTSPPHDHHVSGQSGGWYSAPPASQKYVILSPGIAPIRAPTGTYTDRENSSLIL